MTQALYLAALLVAVTAVIWGVKHINMGRSSLSWNEFDGTFGVIILA